MPRLCGCLSSAASSARSHAFYRLPFVRLVSLAVCCRLVIYCRRLLSRSILSAVLVHRSLAAPFSCSIVCCCCCFRALSLSDSFVQCRLLLLFGVVCRLLAPSPVCRRNERCPLHTALRAGRFSPLFPHLLRDIGQFSCTRILLRSTVLDQPILQPIVVRIISNLTLLYC